MHEKSNGNILEDIISYNNNPSFFMIIIYFSESIKDRQVDISQNIHSSHKFVLSKYEIDTFENLEIMLFSAT